MDSPRIFFLAIMTFITIYGFITYKYYTGTINNLEQKIGTLHQSQLVKNERNVDSTSTTSTNDISQSASIQSKNHVGADNIRMKYPVPVPDTAFREGTVFNPSLDVRPELQALTPELTIPVITVSDTPLVDSRRIVTSIGSEHFPASSGGQQLVGYVASTSPTEDTVMKLYEMIISSYAQIFNYYVVDKNGVSIPLGVRTEEFEDGDVISSIPGYESAGTFKISLYKTGHLVYM